MNHRRLATRLGITLAAAAAVLGVAFQPASLDAQQSRFRVLVPALEPMDGARKNFGEDVAKELRKLMEDMPRHAPVADRDLRDALRKYSLKAEEMNCIQWRQLAVQINAELVMCGSYRNGAAPQVDARFQGAKTGEPFEVEQFATSDAKQAAQRIFSAFENYVTGIALASYCLDYLGSQQWDNALENCERALEVNPNSMTALYGRAEALMRKAEAMVNGDNGGPVGPGADTLATAEVDVDALAEVETEVPAEYTRLMEEALAGFDQVLEVNPIYEAALTAAGYVAAKLGRPDDARAYYERLIELDPTNVDVRLQLALDLARAGDAAGALMIAEEGVELDAENVTLKEYAGHFALAAAQQAVTTGAGNPTELFNKALGHYRAVFDAKGAEADPTMLRNMLATLNQLERYDEAIELGQRVAAEVRDAGVWMVYAESLANAGRARDALVALDTVRAIQPDMPRLSARAGQWLLGSGQLAQAREAFQQAVQQGELRGDDVANLIFGHGYNERYQKGQQEAALPFFDMAREFATSENLKARSRFFTGYVLLQRGQRIQEPGTLASARESLPIFQQALQHLNAAGAYREQEANRQQLLNATRQFIEVQEALIKRGR